MGAAYQRLLYRLRAQETYLVGVPDLGRTFFVETATVG